MKKILSVFLLFWIFAYVQPLLAQATTWEEKSSAFLQWLYWDYFVPSKAGSNSAFVALQARAHGVDVENVSNPIVMSTVELTSSNPSLYQALRNAGAEVLTPDGYSVVVVRYPISQLPVIGAISSVLGIVSEGMSDAERSILKYDYTPR